VPDRVPWRRGSSGRPPTRFAGDGLAGKNSFCSTGSRCAHIRGRPSKPARRVEAADLRPSPSQPRRCTRGGTQAQATLDAETRHGRQRHSQVLLRSMVMLPSASRPSAIAATCAPHAFSAARFSSDHVCR